MKDDRYPPVNSLRGEQIRQAGLPWHPLNIACTPDPRAHFLYHQHVYGPVPANDPYCPCPTY